MTGLATSSARSGEVLDRHEIARRENDSIDVMGGFQGSAGNVGELAMHAGTAAGIAREESEIKAAIVLARSSPRDEHVAYTKIVKSCDRPTFAERGVYRFPRGGASVEGPSVNLAREIARCWGNMRTGVRIVTMDDRMVHVKGYAYDLETNAYVENEAKFSRLIQRKDRQSGTTRWIPADERDLRELVNKHGAICVRNSILQIVPPDIREEAMLRCKDTMRKAAAGELKQDRPTAIRRLVMAFQEFQVTVEMLEKFLNHKLDLITDEEMANLRGVYASMKDGNSKRDDHFEVPGEKATSEDAAALSDDLKRKREAAAKGADGEVKTVSNEDPTNQPSNPAGTKPTAEPAKLSKTGQVKWDELVASCHEATKLEGQVLTDRVLAYLHEKGEWTRASLNLGEVRDVITGELSAGIDWS